MAKNVDLPHLQPSGVDSDAMISAMANQGAKWSGMDEAPEDINETVRKSPASVYFCSSLNAISGDGEASGGRR